MSGPIVTTEMRNVPVLGGGTGRGVRRLLEVTGVFYAYFIRTRRRVPRWAGQGCEPPPASRGTSAGNPLRRLQRAARHHSQPPEADDAGGQREVLLLDHQPQGR